MTKFDVKNEYKAAIRGIIFVIILFSIFRAFNMDIYSIYATLLIISALFMAYKRNFTFTQWGKNAAFLAAFLWVLSFISGLGTIGYTLGIIIVCGVILWKRRKQYIRLKHYIEESIWGKPLNEYVKDKKQVPKIKLVLKKDQQ